MNGTDTMSIKKSLAVLSASAAFVGNAYGVQSETAAYIPVIASMVTSLLLLVTVLAIAKNPLIATASALWWLFSTKRLGVEQKSYGVAIAITLG
jgi:uncharacterized membrane protein YhaH (DUF805 family)